MLEEILNAIKGKKLSKIVSCPSEPISIGGIGTGAEGANDCLGTITVVRVPTSGILYSATLWDLDDEGSQVDLEIFKESITQIADNSAWAPSDADMLKFIIELAFVSFDDHANNQTSEITNIGKAYNAPEGRFFIQAVCRGTPTIASGSAPRFQLHIISYDPDWEE